MKWNELRRQKHDRNCRKWAKPEKFPSGPLTAPGLGRRDLNFCVRGTRAQASVILTGSVAPQDSRWHWETWGCTQVYPALTAPLAHTKTTVGLCTQVHPALTPSLAHSKTTVGLYTQASLVLTPSLDHKVIPGTGKPSACGCTQFPLVLTPSLDHKVIPGTGKPSACGCTQFPLVLTPSLDHKVIPGTGKPSACGCTQFPLALTPSPAHKAVRALGMHRGRIPGPQTADHQSGLISGIDKYRPHAIGLRDAACTV